MSIPSSSSSAASSSMAAAQPYLLASYGILSIANAFNTQSQAYNQARIQEMYADFALERGKIQADYQLESGKIKADLIRSISAARAQAMQMVGAVAEFDADLAKKRIDATIATNKMMVVARKEQISQMAQQHLSEVNKQGKRDIGAIRAHAAASGVVVDSGSIQDIQDEAKYITSADLTAVKINGIRAGFEVEHQGLQANSEARMANIDATYKKELANIQRGQGADVQLRIGAHQASLAQLVSEANAGQTMQDATMLSVQGMQNAYDIRSQANEDLNATILATIYEAGMRYPWDGNSTTQKRV